MNQTSTGNHRFPLLQGILPVDRERLPGEIMAGLTLAVLAIPEVMGYTRIAGTPVITGLYTMLLPMVLFALFGSSRHLVVGADSATAAILAAGLTGMAVAGSEQYLALAQLLALMAGVFLLFARLLRLGFLADFLSSTVLVGFLTGVGIQVALGQVSGMLGMKGGERGPANQIIGSWGAGEAHVQTLMISLSVLAVILVSRRVSRRIPGPLIAVAGAILFSWMFDFGAHGVSLLGKVAGGLPDFGLPAVEWSWELAGSLAPTAFSLFIVILAQSAATSRAYAARHNEHFDENTDLVGLGLANLGAGLSGTFVVNGSPTKTQMVDSAGGRSQLAQLVAVLVALLAVLFLTDVLAYMPTAVLSAIVFMIGLDLVDLQGMRRIQQQAPAEFWVALATAAAVVFVGVEQGILLAMILSLLDHVRRGYRPRNQVLVPGGRHGWRTAPVSRPAQFLPGLMIYRFSHSLYYANAQLFQEEVTALSGKARPPLSWFCVASGAIADVDYTAAETLRLVHAMLHARGIRLVFVAVEEDVKAELDRYGITRLVGEDAFFADGDELVAGYQRQHPDRAVNPV